MKYRFRILTGLAASLFIIGSASAGVVGSKHDMTTATGAAAQTTGATAQVCVFCHTPHGSDASVTAAPLWNKSLPIATDFQDYTSSTLDGTADLAGSPSLACLSCHDGTQAMDTVLNAPTNASGYNYNASGAQIDTGAVDVMAGEPVPVLGEDLRDDHPVSVEYAGGGATFGTAYTANNAAYADSAFQAVVLVSGNSRAGASGLLPLYEKTAGGNAFVECASCHDPHNNTNFSFLRISNDASAVCVSCHDK